MELIKHHIQPSLVLFLNEPNIIFSEIFDNIQNKNRVEHKQLLKYLDSLLNEFNSEIIEELNVIHFHFEDDLDNNAKALIAEYLILKNHRIHIDKDRLIQAESNQVLLDTIMALDSKVASDLYFPLGLTKKQEKQIWNERKLQKSLLKFYRSLSEKASLKFRSLFNSQINLCNLIIQLFEFRPYAIQLTDLKNSYNLLNTNKTLNEIDKFNSRIIDGLENIILFDCERKKVMSNFSLEQIKKWNSEFGTTFTQYFIFTFGVGSYSFNSIRNKIDSIRERFKIPIEKTYTILSSEIDILLNKKDKTSTTVDFIGFETSIYWDSFLIETSIRELYELRSIKLMNIYSLCLNEEIKNYIIEDLFSKNESSDLVSYNTKQSLLELREDDLNSIKEALTNTLDLIINSEIKSKIKEQLDNIKIMILDEAIIRNSKLITKFSSAIALVKSTTLKFWSEISNIHSNSILILSYRDQGKYPNYYYPNLIEFEFQIETKAYAILPNFFFRHQYNWSKYYLLKDYHKYLSHSIRKNHFGWNQLKSKIQSLRPESKLNIDWNLEYEFSNSEQRETYKVKIKNQKTKTFNSSDLFIFKDEKSLNYQVNKIDYLLSLDTIEGKYFIQNLDEIQENINIYEKISDTKQQEEELNIIRKQFNLGVESAGRLWKILLKNIADSKGEDNLYNDLQIYLESKGLKIVSFFHFKNSWINPQSESVAPLSKRVFIVLCEFLKIPKIYFVIIQRIRNASKQSSRQSTRQMNQLLKDLFNDGCFDNGKNARDIINSKLSYYKINHPLDELGINENYLADNLVTLTELIQPELKLMELETIEKIEQ